MNIGASVTARRRFLCGLFLPRRASDIGLAQRRDTIFTPRFPSRLLVLSLGSHYSRRADDVIACYGIAAFIIAAIELPITCCHLLIYILIICYTLSKICRRRLIAYFSTTARRAALQRPPRLIWDAADSWLEGARRLAVD